MPKFRTLLAPVLILASLNLIFTPATSADSGSVEVFISEEVGAWGTTPAQKRPGQQEAFQLADTLDSNWLLSLENLKEEGTTASIQTATITPENPNIFQFLNLNGEILTVTAENVDMKNLSDSNDLGTKSSEGYQYKAKLDLPGTGANTYNGDTMQDFAPVPTRFAGQHHANESQNGFGDQNNFRNGLLFTFSQPLQAFGVWLGDLETRTDGFGAAAILRLFNLNDELIFESIIPPNNWITEGDQNQSICGTNNTTTDLINKMGCGHNMTRFIGFSSGSDSILSLVKRMLIIVGDDDNFADQPEDSNGNTEHISFIGPTVAFFQAKLNEPEPETPVEPEVPTEPNNPDPTSESPQTPTLASITTSTSQTNQTLSLSSTAQQELAPTGQSQILILALSLSLILISTVLATKLSRLDS